MKFLKHIKGKDNLISVMRKIVPVHRKKDIILKNILGRKDAMRKKRKPLLDRRNRSFSEGSDFGAF